ncbi:nucleotidyltransferase family protein [Caenispirillum salinarum]|uniref:nucleotidyltransferase domain-containing protein n=1 Tax=Caenispirillum salinarum TaxID=859058 RepID=UPI00384DCBE7
MPSPPSMRSELLRLMGDPTSAPALTPAQWSALLPVARQARLLGRLAHAVRAAGVLPALPDGPRRHLTGALRLVAAHHRDVRAEVAHIMEALKDLDAPVVLLKGAAYVLGDLPAADGRLFTDTDVMVPAAALNRAESLLALAGWVPAKSDAYDTLYYRRWMHQVPPLVHFRRGTVLDLHHTLVPPTARVALEADLVFGAARPLPGVPGAWLPAPADMVLHSAAHLFNEGMFNNALRDLSDMDRLLRHFAATDPGFWDSLPARARRLDMEAPLAHALVAARGLLGTPVPEAVAVRLMAETGLGPRLLSPVFDAALQPSHPACRGRGAAAAVGFLYLRGHWMRMPLRHLVPHLTRKAWRAALEGLHADPTQRAAR